MPTLKEIKGRIKSINDTLKITNAMYLISSTKFRAVKSTLPAFNEYFEELEKNLGGIMAGIPENECRYLCENSGTDGYLIIASDKGLCGDYNKSVLRFAEETVKNNPGCRFFLIGEKAKRVFDKRNLEYDKSFVFDLGDTDAHTSGDIANWFFKEFSEEKLNKLTVIYKELKNDLTSKVITKQVLPLNSKPASEGGTFEYYPTRQEVLESIMPVYTSAVFKSIMLTAFMCEQNARMTAMNSACNNAKAMLEELTLTYNRTRQNLITQEISEVSGGRKRQ